MLDKICAVPMMTYRAFAGFASGLKKDERGLSDAVTAVLLVLVATLAVTLIWNLLGASIQEWWGKITVGVSNGIN